jgi:FSR family fosmidomycin resistance protein-like MFS transporter
VKNKYLFALSAGHAATDMNVGALAAMLPFLIVASSMNYAQAAGLSFAIAIASTSTQPIFGIIADRLSKTWVVPIGVLMSGCGLALIGLLSHHYWLMFAAALFSGIGVAAFHPEGARITNRLAGKKKGGAMSIFSVGGTMGVATGPLIATPALLYLGLQGSAVLAFPGIIMCILLFFLLPGMRSLVETNEIEERKVEGTTGERKNEWWKFFWICLAITSRSIISHSLNTFLPLYWVNVLHQSKAAGGMVVSFMVFIGAIINLTGGHLADRFGTNKIVKVAWILLIPSVFFLTDITNPVLALLMLVPIAAGNFLLVAPLIVLGQKYLPKSMGLASGIVLGLGGSIGGMVTPFIGGYADIHGLSAAFKLLAILPVLGAVVAFTTKPPVKQ